MLYIEGKDVVNNLGGEGGSYQTQNYYEYFTKYRRVCVCLCVYKECSLSEIECSFNFQQPRFIHLTELKASIIVRHGIQRNVLPFISAVDDFPIPQIISFCRLLRFGYRFIVNTRSRLIGEIIVLGYFFQKHSVEIPRDIIYAFK